MECRKEYRSSAVGLVSREPTSLRLLATKVGSFLISLHPCALRGWVVLHSHAFSVGGLCCTALYSSRVGCVAQLCVLCRWVMLHSHVFSVRGNRLLYCRRLVTQRRWLHCSNKLANLMPVRRAEHSMQNAWGFFPS